MPLAPSASLLPLLAAGSAQPSGLESFMTSPIPMLVAMGVIFWFLIFRPQLRQQKEQKAKLAAIKKGDKVLTGGGLLATVVKVDDTYADLDLGSNLKVKALKSTIADVIPPGGSPAAND
jgi:preprotein translocase subunit YajC